MNKKQSLFHIAKRDTLPWYKSFAIRGCAILLALVVCAVVTMLLTGENPVNIFATIFKGAFGSARKSWVTFQNLAVLLGISLAVTPAFKMRFWNIGAEGQVLIGCLATAACMICLADKLPNAVLILVSLAAALAAGALWGFLPAFFKAKWNTNETLFTLMMNYIIIGVVKWLQGGPWEAPPSGSQMIAQFAGNAKLPSVLGVHCGWIIVLVLTVLMFIYMRYTKHGYEIAVIGDSSNTARYAGMNVGRIMMRTMFLSGSISGLVGFIIVSGANHTLYDGVAGGVGFTAISVAWLAQLNPFAMIIIASMLAVLTKGSQTLNTRMQVPSTIADILTGFILLCMLGCEFFINYKISVRREKED